MFARYSENVERRYAATVAELRTELQAERKRRCLSLAPGVASLPTSFSVGHILGHLLAGYHSFSIVFFVALI